MHALILRALQFIHASDARGPLRPLPREELALESILVVIVLPASSQPLNVLARTCELKCGVCRGVTRRDGTVVVAF